jgi:hypothetical protein
LRFDAITLDIATSGTEVRLSSDAGIDALARVLWIKCQARDGNTGAIYVGIADVATSNGFELTPRNTQGAATVLEVPFALLGGSVAAGDIYFDAANNGDDVDVSIVFR